MEIKRANGLPNENASGGCHLRTQTRQNHQPMRIGAVCRVPKTISLGRAQGERVQHFKVALQYRRKALHQKCPERNSLGRILSYPAHLPLTPHHAPKPQPPHQTAQRSLLSSGTRRWNALPSRGLKLLVFFCPSKMFLF